MSRRLARLFGGSERRALATAVLAIAVYVGVFPLVYGAVGDGTYALSMLPVVVVAWLFGMRVAVLFCLVLGFVIHPPLALLVAENTLQELIHLSIPGLTASLLMAAAVGRMSDLSRRLRGTVDELERARKQAEHANRAKSFFLATMSHEIRTPINAVAGMAELLEETRLSDAQQEYAHVIRTSSTALLALINDVLDVSKIEAGELELEETTFDVRETVQDALDVATVPAAEKDVDVVLDIREDVPARALGDEARLRQVLVNLLSNAVKFTEQGEIVLTVSARSETDGDQATDAPSCHLQVSVRDTGIGISPEGQARLFRPFSQVDASTGRRFGGTGLGLVISKQLVDAMGGAMNVESEEDVGSTFSFDVPVTVISMHAADDGCDARASLHGRRMLLVCGNETRRRVLSEQARRWEMQVVTASSVAEALRRYEEHDDLDVALLDRRLPEVDIADLAERLVDARPGLPLVLLDSAHAPTETRVGLFSERVKVPVKRNKLCQSLLRVVESSEHATADAFRNVPRDVRASRTRQAHRVAGPESGDGRLGAAPTPSTPPDPTERTLRILVAEDNPVNQRLIERLLERRGYAPDIVADGTEVMDALDQQTYDVILMDVRMPVMNGIEASRRITQHFSERDRPRVIAVTADVTDETRAACYDVGMDAFLTKPIDLDELTMLLHRYASETQQTADRAA